MHCTLQSLKGTGLLQVKTSGTNKNISIQEAVYINLDRDTQQRAFQEAKLSRMPFPYQRFNATDAKQDNFLQAGTRERQRVASHGVDDSLKTTSSATYEVFVAIYMSHLRAIESLRSIRNVTSSDYFLVLEDDAMCPPDLEAKLNEFIDYAPSGWDVLRAGWWPTPWANWSTCDKIQEHTWSISQDCHSFGGAHAYIIRAQSLERVLDHFDRLPVSSPDGPPLKGGDDLTVFAPATSICDHTRSFGSSHSHE